MNGQELEGWANHEEPVGQEEAQPPRIHAVESYELSQEEGLSLRGCGDWVDGEVPVSDLA